ncbi:hypothetical protein [Streptomyces sp. NPDC001914]|uniref:hypothetical protein n=1 Tax=Streptomyces sp. NPDC001914 TaxID=3364623 RepID=UPI00368F1CA0
MPLEATEGLETVAVRMPDHPIASRAAVGLLRTRHGHLRQPFRLSTSCHLRAELCVGVPFPRAQETLRSGPYRTGLTRSLEAHAYRPVPAPARPTRMRPHRRLPAGA